MYFLFAFSSLRVTPPVHPRDRGDDRMISFFPSRSSASPSVPGISAGVSVAVDVHQLEDHVDAVAAELVETRLVGRAVHRDAQLGERVEQVHLVHVAALRQRVQQVLHVAAPREDALDALANAIGENGVVVDGRPAETDREVHVHFRDPLVDVVLDGLVIGCLC